MRAGAGGALAEEKEKKFNVQLSMRLNELVDFIMKNYGAFGAKIIIRELGKQKNAKDLEALESLLRTEFKNALTIYYVAGENRTKQTGYEPTTKYFYDRINMMSNRLLQELEITSTIIDEWAEYKARWLPVSAKKPQQPTKGALHRKKPWLRKKTKPVRMSSTGAETHVEKPILSEERPAIKKISLEDILAYSRDENVHKRIVENDKKRKLQHRLTESTRRRALKKTGEVFVGKAFMSHDEVMHSELKQSVCSESTLSVMCKILTEYYFYAEEIVSTCHSYFFTKQGLIAHGENYVKDGGGCQVLLRVPRNWKGKMYQDESQGNAVMTPDVVLPNVIECCTMPPSLALFKRVERIIDETQWFPLSKEASLTEMVMREEALTELVDSIRSEDSAFARDTDDIETPSKPLVAQRGKAVGRKWYSKDF
jgi:hypothetical protein